MPWKRRVDAAYAGVRWKKLRAKILERDGYICRCVQCRALGRVRIATEVDHIKPRVKGGTDDEGNLQAINAECHRLKTIAESGGKPKLAPVRIGVDGFPIV